MTEEIQQQEIHQPATGELKELNINQERFCQLYAGGGEYCGNGVWSYILAYNLQDEVPLIPYSLLNAEQKNRYNTAKSSACENLTKPNIISRCNDLLDALIKDEIVDRELIRVIIQNDELSSKVNAIREYNKLKSRIIVRHDLTTGGKPLILPSEVITKYNLNDTPSDTKIDGDGQPQV